MLSPKRWILFSVAATALAGPYVASQTGLWETGERWLNSTSESSADAEIDITGGDAISSDDASWKSENMFATMSPTTADEATETPAPEFAPNTMPEPGSAAIAPPLAETRQAIESYGGKNEIPFLEIFRFDITPEWVQDHWPRITTSMPEADLFGMRTPVVTGTRLRDLAGSITWYFDDRRQVQRLRFEGTCGDVTDVVAMAMQSFDLDQEPAVGRLVYTKNWHRIPRSVVIIEQPPVIDNAHARQRYLVRMEINLPNTRYDLSPEYEALYIATGAKPKAPQLPFRLER